jgi:Mg2+/Co2+ transporter CorB
MIAATLILIVILLMMSAFFSGSETALTAASRARMYQLEKEGNVRAARVNRLLDRRERLIGTILLGNNVVNILASSLTTSLIVTLMPGAAGVAAATAIMTVLVLIFSEVMPKTYAISRPDRLAMSVAQPVTWLVNGLSWVTVLVQAVVDGVLRAVGVRPMAHDLDAADAEIRGAIDLGHQGGGVESQDRRRLTGALDLKDLTVADLMVHRKNISMINADLPAREIIMKVLSSPHTRLPLYRGEKEEIIGILHAKDLLRAVAASGGHLDKVNIPDILREPWFVPETLAVTEQLDAFLKERRHFALVIDEYGELEGLITLEDILEEIVGDIRDEHDQALQGLRHQPDGSVIVDGWVHTRDLNRAMDWHLPDEEAATIAGLVIHESQTIPDVGQSFSFHGFRFDVLRKTRNQITALRVEKLEAPGVE